MRISNFSCGKMKQKTSEIKKSDFCANLLVQPYSWQKEATVTTDSFEKHQCWSEQCLVVASWQSHHLWVKKTKKWKKQALEIVPDQTQLRSKTFLIRPKCAWRGYDQTQLRSKLLLIRPKCARLRLWSDFSDQIGLWSDHLQTMVQTVERSNLIPEPVILVWERTGVRSTESDYKLIWVWTSTLVVCFPLGFSHSVCLKIDNSAQI